jgi:hypothetical protein
LNPGRETGDSITVHGEEYTSAASVDVSRARGLTHLRNALLEDRSFERFDVVFESSAFFWQWALVFRDGKSSATLLFSEDCEFTSLSEGRGGVASCAPISGGLLEMFAEMRQ